MEVVISNMWPHPGKRGMEEVELTCVTTAHGPLARARLLQERMGKVEEHMGYLVRKLK